MSVFYRKDGFKDVVKCFPESEPSMVKNEETLLEMQFIPNTWHIKQHSCG